MSSRDLGIGPSPSDIKIGVKYNSRMNFDDLLEKLEMDVEELTTAELDTSTDGCIVLRCKTFELTLDHKGFWTAMPRRFDTTR